MELIKVVLCPAVGVTGSIWSGNDDPASVQSPLTAEELELIGVGGMIRVMGLFSCGSPAVRTSSCTELPVVLDEGVERQDARLLSIGGWRVVINDGSTLE